MAVGNRPTGTRASWVTVEELDYDKEAILFTGLPGSGKTFDWLEIADCYPGTTFWCIDPDRSAVRALSKRFKHLKNVRHTKPNSWTEIEKAKLDIDQFGKYGDFVILEMLGRFWDMAQAHFFSQVYAKHGGDYLAWLMAERKAAVDANKSGKPANLDGKNDWPLIRKLHDEVVDDLVVHSPFNIIATTSLNDIVPGTEAGVISEVKELFGSEKIEGEKHNIYRFQTVIRCRRNGQRFSYETLKDREYPLIKRNGFTDLSKPDGVKNFWEDFCEHTGREA